MTVAIFIVLILALAGSSAAVVLLAVLERRRETPFAGIALRLELFMIVVLLANIAGFLLETFAVPVDARLEFILMTIVNLSIVAISWWVLQATATAASVRISGRGRAVYLAVGTFVYVASVYFSFFGDPTAIVFENADGFEISSLFGSAVVFVCTLYLFMRRERIRPEIRKTVLYCSSALSFLGLLSCVNEEFHLASLLGVAQIPISPFLLNFQNALVLTFSMRSLAGKRAAEPGTVSEGRLSEASGEFAFPIAVGESERMECCVKAMFKKYGLSKRECELLPLLISGIDNEGIGSRLFISIHTVKNHVHSIFMKTGAASRFDLMRIARESVPE